MSQELASVVFSLSLFLGVLLALVIGRRIGVRRAAQDPEGARAGVAAVEGAVFGLMGLLIAFTFSGAAARFDARRQLAAVRVDAIVAHADFAKALAAWTEALATVEEIP